MPHYRSPEIKQISLADLHADPEFDHDEQFLRLVKQELQGKIKISLTRLRTESITSGFYKRENGATRLISNLKSDDIQRLLPHIRGGGRPAVEVYWSVKGNAGGGYVCPDTELTLATYRKLGFEFVPARIMKPIKRQHEEGAIWIEQRDKLAGLSRIESPIARDYLGYGSLGDDVNAVIDALKIRCESAQRAITDFHIDSGANLHYHQMLHAVIRRHARSLDTIGWAISRSRLEHAYILTRAAYEAFLNFYLDWLSPEFFGPRIQLLSFVRTGELEESSLDVLSNFKEFLESTIDKARVSALREHFYRAIYTPLSRVVHQSYSYVEREAHDFLDEPDDEASVTQLAVCLNVLTAALIERVTNDVPSA